MNDGDSMDLTMKNVSDLAAHIHEIRVCDTHEHLCKENEWVGGKVADVLADLFRSYIAGDLCAAGASAATIERVAQADKFDLATRWAGIADAWEAVRFTGYGEAVRFHAKQLYGIEEITPKTLAAAQPRFLDLIKPGMRLTILRDWAKLDHVQVDDFSWACLPDASGPDFFLYDIRWFDFCCGRIDFAALATATGVTVTVLPRLREALEILVAKYAPVAIAFKSQH